MTSLTRIYSNLPKLNEMEFKELLLFVITLCLSALTSPQDSCGQRPLVAPPGMSRIVGGREAPEGAWPWQVSIQIQSIHHCSGTIVSSLTVLTATHCFHKFRISTSHFRVVAGLCALSAPGDQTQIRSISKVQMHEDYNDVTSDNDVTLVLLSSPFAFTDYIQPVCTPHNVTHELILNFSQCFITGWGSTYYTGGQTNRLQEAEVELIDRRTCNLMTWYNGLITENMICAGLESGASDSCQGDSGGPLQCYSEDEDRFYLVGVTSFGYMCGVPRKPGVYARTSRFAAWLNTCQTASAPAAHGLHTGLISALLCVPPMLLLNPH
ncbi:transmembrane protease serine 11D isoform X2 [Pungitius pungitius]|uniref:transmembrane protease serine 11D isoform X2 n=1 Tax=Pungitius pungitius TaxID=134920 RepID=UPI00188717B9|nr:transmembrane protease serine 11D isoform X2 [Pungitius pungitius]